jgi:transposase
MDLIQAATAMGATLTRACECLGLSIRTIQRWREEGGGDDQRRGPATTPHNKLSAEEEAEVLRVATSADFADLSPNQIVPHLATHRTYIGSESTIYRRLHAAGMMRRRGRARAPSRRPRALTATGPDARCRGPSQRRVARSRARSTTSPRSTTPSSAPTATTSRTWAASAASTSTAATTSPSGSSATPSWPVACASSSTRPSPSG